MKLHLAALLSIVFAAAGWSQAQAPKIAIVNIQDAIVGTTDGRNANQQLETEFRPKKTKLDAERTALTALQDRLRDDDELGPGVRGKLAKEITDKTILINLETDQDDADLAAAQKKVISELGRRMVTVIAAYAASQGYAVVFDVSGSQAPLLYADDPTDITREVIAAYESKYRK